LLASFGLRDSIRVRVIRYGLREEGQPPLSLKQMTMSFT